MIWRFCLKAQNVDVTTFRKMAYTFGLCFSDEERKKNLSRVRELQKHDAFGGEEYQKIMTEFLEKDINDPDPVALTPKLSFSEEVRYSNEVGDD